LLSEERVQSGELAIQERIGKRRVVVLGCLDDSAAEPTNNRAERSLRDVGGIAGKIPCGNKTESGKTAWERLTSLAVTCQQRRRVVGRFGGGPPGWRHPGAESENAGALNPDDEGWSLT
jgi:hypothetical protein